MKLLNIMASLKPQLLKLQDNEPSYTERPQFIVLCGPTGVGKSMVPQQIFKLEERDYTKIEIDSLVVQNQLYTNTIFTINNLDKNLIVNTIKGKDIKKRKLLTDLFNELYSNVKNNITPCVKYDTETQKYDTETQKFTCSQLHDYLLAKAIIGRKTIVLEINGDKDFKWLFKDTKKIEDLFTNEHRGIIRNEYKTTIFYLSHNYKKLLESNKTRFLQNIKDCVPKSCIARLGNFLLPDIYRKTINGIFTVYAELSNFFQENNIAVRFYERTDGNNYLKLEDFEKYKESFKLLHEDIESRPWSVILSPRVFSVFTSRGKGRRKTQKAKRKKQKAKIYKKLKLL
jgi:hypothetical protein